MAGKGSQSMIKLKPPLSNGNFKDDKISVNQKNRT